MSQYILLIIHFLWAVQRQSREREAFVWQQTPQNCEMNLWVAFMSMGKSCFPQLFLPSQPLSEHRTEAGAGRVKTTRHKDRPAPRCLGPTARLSYGHLSPVVWPPAAIPHPTVFTSVWHLPWNSPCKNIQMRKGVKFSLFTIEQSIQIHRSIANWGGWKRNKESLSTNLTHGKRTYVEQ